MQVVTPDVQVPGLPERQGARPTRASRCRAYPSVDCRQLRFVRLDGLVLLVDDATEGEHGVTDVRQMVLWLLPHVTVHLLANALRDRHMRNLAYIAKTNRLPKYRVLSSILFWVQCVSRVRVLP